MKSKARCKWTGLFLVVACVGFCLSLPGSVQGEEAKSSAKKPDIQFKEKTFDFGNVYKGAVVTHKFEYTNKGDGVLKIDKVKTSCGCTAALTTSKIVKPGESGAVEASFRSKNFRGRITKTIYVHSNDPDEKVIQLAIKGVVLEEVALTPQRISFNMIEKGTEQSKSFHVRQEGKESLNILKVDSNLKFLSAKVESVDKIFKKNEDEKLDYEVKVTVGKNAPSGRFNGMLTIKTNLKRLPEIKYYVIGIVR